MQPHDLQDWFGHDSQRPAPRPGMAGVPRSARLGLLAATVLAAGCGGGGGGGGDGGGGGTPGDTFDPDKDFYLSKAFIARPVFDSSTGDLEALVNPASLYEVDPITGVTLPGYPKPLVAGTSLETLVSFNFAQILDPLTPQIPLVPRNAAVVLEFSKPVAPGSLLLSDANPDEPGLVTATSAVQVRRKDGTFVSAQAVVDGARIVLHPFVGEAAGWEASPLVFDKFGNAVSDSAGWLRVVLDQGAGLLASETAEDLVARPDGLGTSAEPLPFNPGNPELDAIVLQTESGAIGFNGFLPDLTAPRIIRQVEAAGVIEAIGSAPGGLLAITGEPLAVPANVTANGGVGEWANSLLVVDGAGGVTSQYVVTSNFGDAGDPAKPVFVLAEGTLLAGSVVPGSAFVVTRSEFYEPIPPPLPTDPLDLAAVTVDPDAHPRDPDDPQDAKNHDLRYFVRMYGEDGTELTSAWNPAVGLFSAVTPRVRLRLRFSEAMEASSFLPYETFYVTELEVPKSSPAFNRQRIGVVEASTDGREITFSPILRHQLDPSQDEFIGLGGTAASLRLTLRSIPDASQIDAVKASVSATQAAKLLDLATVGVSGITDLGGQSLGLPLALLDQGDPDSFFLEASSPGFGAFPPAIDFSLAFQTQPSADPDWGAVVHRFSGQPITSIFSYPPGELHDPVTSGIEYHDYPPEDEDDDGTVDRRYIYGPSLLDVGLNLPGRLTGAPAAVIEHLMDDFNKPKASSFASPTGEEDVLAKIGFGVATPLNSSWGARFQHVYRAGDASPAYNDYVGVVLDLVGLAWSPLNSPVQTVTLDDMEILVGLSNANQGLGPNTNQENGIPVEQQSGLGDQFDCNLLEWTENCCKLTNFTTSLVPYIAEQPPLTPVVAAGTPYVMSNTQLFRPANAAGLPASQFNYYLNYPAFNTGLDPYFGQDDVFSFPYDSRFPMLIEYRIKPQDAIPSTVNIFRFSPGSLSSVLPRFRVWSQGQDPYARCVPPCFSLCTTNYCRGGEGGPLLEPGSFTQSVPAPNPDGLNGLNGQWGVDPPPEGYILPPFSGLPLCTPLQTEPDGDTTYPCDGSLPRCNTLPEMNWYFANGMFQNPLPNTNCFPGKQGLPPTAYFGYGPGSPPPTEPISSFSFACPGIVIEPNYLLTPARYGDNSRYHMLWQYRKRVSRIESPAVRVLASSVEYGLPFIEPPLADVPAGAGLRVEFRASSAVDFGVPALDSGYVDQGDPDFGDNLTGLDLNRVYVKFRATYAVAPGSQQPPALDSVVIPYLKVTP
jgi:hypothetical protein